MNAVSEKLNAVAELWASFVWNSSWQSALLVTLCLGLVLIGRKLPAPVRYSILILALVKFAVPPFLALPTGFFSSLPELQVATAHGRNSRIELSNKKPDPVKVIRRRSSDSGNRIVPRHDRGNLDEPPAEPVGKFQALVQDRAQSKPGTGDIKPTLPKPVDMPNAAEKFPIHSVSGTTTVKTRLTLPAWLMLAHVSGSMLLLLAVCVSLFRLVALRRRASDIDDKNLANACRTMCVRLGMARVPRLMQSSEIAVPISFGCVWPIVMLPAKLVSQPHLAMIAMTHELAHHRRLDPWINWLQNILLAAWWVNPLIWVLNAQIRRLREVCCDDLLLEKQLADSETYSQSIIEIVRMSTRRCSGRLSIACGMTAESLAARIRRIMDPTVKRRSGLSRIGIAALLLACVVCLPGRRISTANDLETDANAQAGLVTSDKIPNSVEGPSSELPKPIELPVVMNQDVEAKPADGDGKFRVAGRVEKEAQNVENVRVLLFRIDYRREGSANHVQIGEAHTDKEGSFEIVVDEENAKSSQPGSNFSLICLEADGRSIGGVAHISMGPTRPRVEFSEPIQLIELKAETIFIVDENDRPVAGAKVETGSFSESSFAEHVDARRLNQYTPKIDLPSSMADVVKTDDTGRAMLPRVAVTGTTLTTITLPNGARFVVSFGSPPMKVKLDSSAQFSGSVTCEDKTLNFEDVLIRYGVDDQSGIFDDYIAVFWTKFAVNSDGSFEVKHATPGTFTVGVDCTDDRFFVADQPPNFNLASGEKKVLPTMEFRRGIPLRGRVVDAETGEGVADVYVNLNALKPGQRVGFWGHHPRTDSRGEFVAHVPSAKLSILYPGIPPGYLEPTQSELTSLREFDATTGESEYRLPDLKLRKGITLRGRTVDSSGEPIGNVNIWALMPSNVHNNSINAQSDDSGQFEIKGVDPDDFVTLRGYRGDLVTDGGIVVDAREYDGEIELELSDEFAFQVKAQFVDNDGKPVPAAKLAIQRHVRYVSRNSGGMNGMWMKFGEYESNQDGSFSSRSLTPGDQYSLTVSADGHASFTSAEVKGESGEIHDFGTIALARTSLVATGQVVDLAGQPVADATVFNVGDAPLRIETKTDAQGRFALSGLPEGSPYVFVAKPGYRFVGQRAVSLAQPLKVEIRGESESPADQSGLLPPFTYDQRKEICKYMIGKMYSLPVDQRAEINFVLLRYMASVDPALAMTWASDPANESRRGDVMIEIAKSLIDGQPEEALSLIAQVPTGSYFGRIMELAERLVDSSPEVAMKLAEDLEVRLEKLEPPNSIYHAAQLGNLLLKLGKDNAGNWLIEDAFKSAEQFPGDNRTASFVKGFTAELLAHSDLDRSLRLIDQIVDTEGDKTRHLGNLAARIASTNPTKAIEILSTNEGRYFPRVAHEIAKANLDSARNIVQMLLTRSEHRYACDAMVAIALACHETDPQLAYELIDQSFQIYMSRPQDFDSWSNFGCEAGPASFTTAIARKIGYPDVAGLVTKTLASRRGSKEFGFNEDVSVLQATLVMAKYIALTDRNTSRQLLEQIGQRADLLGGGGSSSLDQTDWLIAWCMTDIEKAKSIFDEMLDRESGGHDVMRQNHLTRALMHLTLPDEKFYSELSRDGAIWYPGRE